MPVERSERVRKTLFYPATYLTGAGIGMLVAPELYLRGMLSAVDYEPAMVQMCGLFLLGLAMFVILTIRHRLTMLHGPIIGIRVVFCTGYVVLYLQTGDPLFLTTLGVVGTGVIASSIAWLRGSERGGSPIGVTS